MKRMRLTIMVIGLTILALAAQAQWEPAKRLTYTAGESYRPRIAVDSGGYVYLVWFDYTPGDSELYFRKSTDGGGAWSATKRLTWTSGNSQRPAIAVDDPPIVHLAWNDYAPGNSAIYYMKSTNGGATWSARKRLTWTSGDSGGSAIAVDPSGYVYVFWHDATPGAAEIYYRKSTDGGTNWSASTRLTWNSGESEWAKVAVDSSGVLHVAWEDSTPGNYDILYKKSTDGGATWSTSRNLSANPAESSHPDVVAGPSSAFHVVWEDTATGNSDIYYLRSTDGGGAWSTAKRLTWNAGESSGPDITVDASGRLHLVWGDYTPGDSEIFYKKSTDGGATWVPAERLTWNSGNSWAPDIAVFGSDNIHVVWYDDTPGNLAVYYIRQK